MFFFSRNLKGIDNIFIEDKSKYQLENMFYYSAIGCPHRDPWTRL